MSNIDLSRIVTAPRKQAARREAAYRAARAECARRILAACDAPTQVNLAAAAAAGLLSPPQRAAYRALLQWIARMQAAWRPLAEAGRDPGDPAAWPGLPEAAAELSALF